jgi:hypothetical protein
MSRTRNKSRRKLDTIANSVATVAKLATGQTLVYSSNAWSNGYPQGFSTYPVDITGILPNQTLVWNGTRWAPATATVSVTGIAYLGANPYLANTAGGDQVQLTGTGLNAVQSVIIDNTPISVFTATATALTITTPALASGFHIIYLITGVGTFRVAPPLAVGTTIVLVVGTPDITLNSAAAYSNNLTITGGIGTVTISLIGTLSSYLTYLNGTISGTLPRVSQDLSYSYTINATDGVQTVSAIATVTVKFIPILWVTPAGNLRTVSDAARSGFSFTLSATYLSSPITVFGLTSGALPSGLSLNATTGVLSGNIAGVISNTVYSFTVTAFTSDGFTSNARDFTITVNARTVDTALPYVSQLLKTAPILTNSIVPDLSANGIAVTKSSAGSPATGSTSPYQTDGYWSNQFNGSSDYLQFPAGTAFAPGTGDFTLEGWVYVITHNTSQGNFFWTQSTPGTNYFLLTFGTGGAGWTAIASGVGPTISGPTVTINTNTWYHLAVTRASGTVRVYVNGVSGTPGTNTTDISNTSWTPTLGSYTHVSWGLWAGYVSNVRYVKGVAVYSGSFTPPSLAPLTAAGATSAACYPSTTNVNTTFAASNTSLLTCQSNRFKDNSANNFLVSVISAPRTSFTFYPTGFTAPAASPGAALFNGSTDYLSAASSTAFAIGTGDFTVEFWVYLNAIPGNYPPVLVIGTNFYINFRASGTIALTDAATVYATTASALIINTWYHIAVVRSAGSLKIYTNGVGGTAVACTVNFAQGAVLIGRDSATFYLSAYISNFRIVKGTAVYTGNFAPPTNFLQTSGAASAASYTNTANVNTTFPAANTVLLLNFADSSSYITASNGVANNTFIDGSANAFPITRTGTPTQGSSTPYWPNGYWSNYFAGGASDYLSSTTASTVLQFGTNPYTVEGWVYQTARSDTRFICGGAFSGNGFQANINASGYIAVGIPGFSDLTASTIAIPLNTWTHFAFVRTSTSTNGFTYYINGTAAGTITDANNYSGTATTLNVATTNNSSLYVLTGYLSNLRIVKGVAVYTGAFTPPTALLATTQSAGTNIAAITGTATSLLTCQSNRFRDNSNTNATISVNGTAQVRPVHPFLLTNNYSAAAYGGSGYFNGSTDYITYNQTFALGTNDFTIEFWLYVPVNPVYPTNYWLWGWRNNTDNCPGMYLNAVSGGGNTLWFTGNTGFISNPSSIPTNSWNHIAIVRLGSGTNNLKMYINGVQVAQVTNTQSFTYTGTQPVGANPSGNGGLYPANVYFSNFRIVNGTAVYTGAFTPPTLAPLTTAGATSAASYSSTTNVNTTFASSSTGLLLNFANAAIYDATGQNSLVTAGSAQISTTVVPQWGNTSMQFNGSTDYLTMPTNPAFAFSGSAFTVEFWVYANVLPTNPAIAMLFDTRPASTQGAYILLYLNFDGTIRLWVSSADRITSSVISTGTWYYVALTRSSGSTKLFLNGIQTGLTYSDSTVYLAAAPLIGASYSGGASISNFFNGYMQDLRITRGIGRTITASPTDEFSTIAVDPLTLITTTTTAGPTTTTTAGPTTTTTAGPTTTTTAGPTTTTTAGPTTTTTTTRATTTTVAPTTQPPVTNPPNGTLLSTYCSGYDKYGTYANGSGGTYTALIQANSTDCGYVVPTNATVTYYVVGGGGGGGGGSGPRGGGGGGGGYTSGSVTLSTGTLYSYTVGAGGGGGSSGSGSSFAGYSAGGGGGGSAGVYNSYAGDGGSSASGNGGGAGARTAGGGGGGGGNSGGGGSGVNGANGRAGAGGSGSYSSLFGFICGGGGGGSNGGGGTAGVDGGGNGSNSTNGGSGSNATNYGGGGGGSGGAPGNNPGSGGSGYGGAVAIAGIPNGYTLYASDGVTEVGSGSGSVTLSGTGYIKFG